MLQSLMVKNFAIIDNISLDFSEGFTSITGETGAGKSLLIDAIGLLLGDRASATMVRHGESKAIIEGVFSNLGVATKEILQEFDLYDEDDDLLIIKKEIQASGKSLVRVNGYTVNMSQLDMLASTLADIHTQNDTKKLFDPKNYLYFIDDKNSLELLKEYRIYRDEYIKKIKNLNNLVENVEEYKKERDYLEYQYSTLANANLIEGELESLTYEFNLLNHFELIHKNLNLIKSSFNEYNVTNSIYDILNSLEKIAQVDEKYKDICDSVKNCYYELSDVESTISQRINHLEFDSDRFEEINNRINYLKNLSYKYKKSISELIEYRDSLENKINLLSDDKYLVDKARKEVIETYNKTLEIATKLSDVRKINAKGLNENIKSALKDLMLEKVRLEINFSSTLKDDYNINSFGKNGIDSVNILISFNPGEELKELSKVASGGEMSRVMLAVKTHLLSNLQLATMIFDEIDSGVSGEVAYEVAKKLKEISKHTQVLAITHLPIVASLADNQLLISKKIENEVTSTIVTQLDYNGRIEVLSKLISPNDSTGKSKELAIQMLNSK